MKKIFIVLVGVLVSWFGYTKYQESQANALIEASMRDATVRVSTQFKYMRGGHGVSYAEFLRQIDADLKELTDSYVKVRSTAVKAKPEVLKHGLDYLEKSQQSLRAARRVGIAIVEFRAARKAGQDAIEKLERFVANPTDIRNQVRADMTDADAVSGSIKSANTEFDVAIAEFQIKFSELGGASKAKNKSIAPSAYLNEEDMAPITINLK